MARRQTDAIEASINAVEAVMHRTWHQGPIRISNACCAAAMQVPGATREGVAEEDMGSAADLVVVVGGDGSLLGFGREMAASGVPVVGVNRGGLGFLAAISPDQIDSKV